MISAGHVERMVKMRNAYKIWYGQFSHSLDKNFVAKERSYWWSKFGDIKGKTESTIVATHDKALSKNYFKKKIMNEEIQSNA